MREVRGEPLEKGPYACSECGSLEHTRRACPKVPAEEKKQKCGKCHRVGHNARACPRA